MKRLVVLGLQGIVMRGTEPTFDGQTVPPGTHLRWSIAPEVGFPPGGFWLLRRKTVRGEHIPPPRMVGVLRKSLPSQSKGAPLWGQPIKSQSHPPTIDPILVNPFTGTPIANATLGEWGAPELADNGWQCLLAPFTLPITRANWPARYHGAPDPLSMPPADVAHKDYQEALRRLGGLRLQPGQDPMGHIRELRATLDRLLAGFPATLLNDVPIAPSATDGASAPQLGLANMDQLLLAALSPYMARVLGLYYVDQSGDPGVAYDYCIVGLYAYHSGGTWNAVPCGVDALEPGAAPAQALGRGWTRYGSLSIAAPGGFSPTAVLPPASPSPPPLQAQLMRWVNSSDPRVNQGVPAPVIAACVNALPSLGVDERPRVVLIARRVRDGAGEICHLTLNRPVMQVWMQVAGYGTMEVFYHDETITVAISTLSSSDTAFHTRVITATSRAQPITDLVLHAAPGVWNGDLLHPMSLLLIGRVALSLVPQSAIGVPIAMFSAPQLAAPLVAPATPLGIFKHREAVINPSGPALQTVAYFDVQWPAPTPPAATAPGDPEDDAASLPPPTTPLGFVVERADVREGTALRLPRLIAAHSIPRPPESPLPSERVFRFMDANVPDPVFEPTAPTITGYAYRLAGFDVFGLLGNWSAGSHAIGVQHAAPAPTKVEVLQFDNSVRGGGHKPGGEDAWVGGTLSARISWDGGARLTYPDMRSARLTVAALDAADNTMELAHVDFAVPPPLIVPARVMSITPPAAPASADKRFYTPGTAEAASGEGMTTITLDLALPVGRDPEPPVLLVLIGPPTRVGAPIMERYPVQLVPEDGGVNFKSSVYVAAGQGARIVANADAFIGTTAYLVRGTVVTQAGITVPLRIPLSDKTARGQITVQPSRAATFDPAEVISDPNHVSPDQPEPISKRAIFIGQQWYMPPAPPLPMIPTPSHIVHHQWYDPADFLGRASVRLNAFSLPSVAGVTGYYLYRASLHQLMLTDIERRRALAAQGLNGLTDGALSVTDGGGPRGDLQLWHAANAAWLAAFNARNGTSYAPAQVLDNSDAALLADAMTQRRACMEFMEHFYGGLLDDEWRALADLVDTRSASGSKRNNGRVFARLGKSILPGTALSDTVDGHGGTAWLYSLSSANDAGSENQQRTPAVGPFYTRPRVPPSSPPLCLVQQGDVEPAVTITWSLSGDLDVAGYLLYRATSADALADVRYFGDDPAHALTPAQVAQVEYVPNAWPVLRLNSAPPDPRILTLVADPRLFARDYEGSDMGEVILPTSVIPTAIQGVYRLDAFDSAVPSAQPGAFNYWRAGGGNTAQMVTDSPSQARITGLRLGLDAGVPVVVVATVGGATRVMGTLPTVDGGPTLRVTYTDATPPAAHMWYCVVALDIHGNRSAASPRATY